MYPIIEVLYEATGSKAGTVFMMMIIYFVIGCSQFNILASVSRLTWYVYPLSTLLDIISFQLTQHPGHSHATVATLSQTPSRKCTPPSASPSTPSSSHPPSASSSTSSP
jgi:hypothetical protein